MWARCMIPECGPYTLFKFGAGAEGVARKGGLAFQGEVVGGQEADTAVSQPGEDLVRLCQAGMDLLGQQAFPSPAG
jgi:hypothetical protein